MNPGSVENTRESDEALIRKIQKGDSETFAEILGRYQAKIQRYVRKFLYDQKDAEDTVQEVFIKAYRNIQSFDPERKFSSWLYRIAHNQAINFLRKRRIETLPLLDLDTFFPHLAKEEHSSEVNALEIKEQMEISISRLDLKYREPLVLYYLEGFDYKEIAEILRVPLATVGVRMNRGRKLLKEKYDQLNLN